VPRKGARFVAKTLKSAMANAEDLKTHKQEYRQIRTERLRVKEAVAQTASTYKRFTPKARGSAGPILKRNCHVKIVLSDE
jgi:large subunit ribosomal protein L22